MMLATAKRQRAPARLSEAQIATALAGASIVEIAERAGLVMDPRKSRPASGDYWAVCPFHQERTASLHLKERGGESWFRCFGCGEKGDLIAFHRKLHGGGFRQTVESIGGGLDVEPDPALIEARAQRRREMEAEAKRMRAANRAAAVAIWEAAEPIAGTPATRYLRECRRVQGYLGAADLRWHPAASLAPYEPQRTAKRPAMVARVVNASNEHIGTHLTFLARDGSNKLQRKGSRIIVGEHKGGFIRLGHFRDAVVIGEGIETTLSASDACGLPGLAAVNASNLAAVVLPEHIKRVVIAHDRDPKGAGEIAAAALAERLWAEGRAPELFSPPVAFKDWNDAAQAGAIRKAERAA